MAAGRIRGSGLTSDITVRLGGELDVDRVAEIKVRSWAQTYGGLIPEAALRPLLDQRAQTASLHAALGEQGSLLLVAEREPEGVVGFAFAFLERSPEPWLESLHVFAELRRHGAGTLLMRATAAHVTAAGHRSMRLGVVEGNAAAERFYERLGAVDAGFEPVTWAPGAMHHIYRWPDLRALA